MIQPRPVSRPKGDRRAGLRYVPLLGLLILWLWLFSSSGAVQRGPTAVGLSSDFAMFWTAAAVMPGGANAYDPAVLVPAEQRLQRQEGLPVPPRSALIRVGNPPLFFWALGPLTRVPYQTAALLWFLASCALFALCTVATLLWLGWRRPLLPALMVLASPPVVLSVYYGGPDALVLVGLVGALILAQRSPSVAGAVATLALLKPQLGLPFILLILLFHASERRAFLAGFGAACAGALMLMLCVVGLSGLTEWLDSLLRYSSDIGSQPNIVSLTGLYARIAPQPVRLTLEALQLLAAAALTLIAWRRQPHSAASVAWLWFAWLLASPYAHFPDLTLLLIPVLAVAMAPGRAVTGMAYLLFGSLLLFSAAIGGVQLLPLAVLAAGVSAWLATRAGEPAHGELIGICLSASCVVEGALSAGVWSFLLS